MRTGNSLRTDAAPLNGREISISYLEHDIDAAEDRLLLHVWEQPDAGWPAHTYDVYRNGPGWNTLWTGLNGGPQQMAAAAAWWNDQRNTMPYAGYRILTAVDGYGRATIGQLERELQLAAGTLRHDGLYARALAALVARGLVEAQPSDTLAVTPAADTVLRPEDPDSLVQFTQMLNTVDAPSPGVEAASRPDPFDAQPVTYTHWAVFTDGPTAEQCVAAFNAQPGWSATVQPAPHRFDEWIVLAHRTAPRAQSQTYGSQARLIARHHGAVHDGGETTHAAAAPVSPHPAAAAFPAPPQPSPTSTAASATTAAAPSPTQTTTARRTR
jgi:hypothetical protein